MMQELIKDKEMSDRKYRQRGYMDHGGQQDKDSGPKPSRKPNRRNGKAPRSPKMMAYGQKVKCAACGATIETNMAAKPSARSAMRPSHLPQ